MAKIGLLGEPLPFNRCIQVVAIEIFCNVITPVCCAAGGVADGKHKGDNDNDKQGDKYPATVADEMMLNPGDHLGEL